LKAYSETLLRVKLSGPTNFEPIISKTTMMAKEQRKQVYNVLLILTDGDITDMQATITALVEASSQPLSVIIIGVGDENFESMGMLDGDRDGLKSEHEKRAERDVVQFVALKDCKTQEDLVSECLSELPLQLVSYMASKKIAPPCWTTSTPPFQLPAGEWKEWLDAAKSCSTFGQRKAK